MTVSMGGWVGGWVSKHLGKSYDNTKTLSMKATPAENIKIYNKLGSRRILPWKIATQMVFHLEIPPASLQ